MTFYINFGAKNITRFRFDRVDRFNRVYDGTKYLVLLRPEKNASY